MQDTAGIVIAIDVLLTKLLFLSMNCCKYPTENANFSIKNTPIQKEAKWRLGGCWVEKLSRALWGLSKERNSSLIHTDGGFKISLLSWRS